MSLFACVVSLTASVHATSESGDTIKKILDIFTGKSDTPAAPVPTPAVPAPAAAVTKEATKKPEDKTPEKEKTPAKKEEVQKEKPVTAVKKSTDVQPTVPPKTDFSSIDDPTIRACAEQYNTKVTACANDSNCTLEARHTLKGCIRPAIARNHLYAYIAMFNKADDLFRKAGFYRECADTFSQLRPQCNGNKGCEEVLYYSLHKNCGKRFFHKGYVQKRSSTVEDLVINTQGSKQKAVGTSDNVSAKKTTPDTEKAVEEETEVVLEAEDDSSKVPTETPEAQKATKEGS
ncbi:MAG: hypothetical protein H6849_03195 [Alphaproteobacteria bacterium]|nr:MAG: hypothetical protein H6849_03195 [Alphaproteobacteria bacterium]